jgi:hypothetical protein
MNEDSNGVRIYCVCGEEVPLKVITEDEPDADVKEHYFGKVVLMCYKCYTITEVSGTIKKAIDDAAKLAMSSGEEKSVYLS